jgi:hypothetical protein
MAKASGIPGAEGRMRRNDSFQKPHANEQQDERKKKTARRMLREIGAFKT